MHREPDVGFDPGSPGSRPGPKAGAKPLRHPGIPTFALLFAFPTIAFPDSDGKVEMVVLMASRCPAFQI